VVWFESADPLVKHYLMVMDYVQYVSCPFGLISSRNGLWVLSDPHLEQREIMISLDDEPGGSVSHFLPKLSPRTDFPAEK